MVGDAPIISIMTIKYVSWELFEERFQEGYLSEEFIERQLNDFDALR
jgi:hypothetical protein